MPITLLTKLPGGGVDLTVDFQNAVFGVAPAVAVVAAMLVVASLQWSRRYFCRGRSATEWVETMLLLPLAMLHLASLIVSCKLSAHSSLCTNSLATASYTLRLIASVTVFFGRILWNADCLLVTNLYLLVTCIADGVRVHTLWRLAKLDPPTGFALPTLQVAVIIMTAVAFLFSELCSGLKPRAARKGRRVYVDEPGSGAGGMLFLGWLWPLLKYGLKNKLVADDLKSSLPRPTATYRLQTNNLDLFDADFWGGAAVNFLGAMLIRILGAATLLAQPFIINGIMSFLQSNQNRSVGAWLVVSMLFNLFQAHGDQLFLQLANRVRSFLIHNVALRSFGATPPEGADWEAASGKVLVRLSQDSAAVSGAVIMSGMIVPNVLVVGVGSYVLFKYINLAFLGPLIAVVVCLLAPMLLGGPLSRSQRKLLEAAESRIQIVKNLLSEIRIIRFSNMQQTAAQQATQCRQREIDAATTFRGVLTFVVVIATFTMSLANLAAFGGVALLPWLSFDYTVLFTSLSMIQIMIMPLLSILQMLPEFSSTFVSWKRIRDYVARGTNEGKPADTQCQSKEDTDGLLLYLNNFAAGWALDSTFLNDVHLSVSPQDLLVVSGAPGCGKSSFLKALLGEARVTGTTRMGAKHLTYCDQVPWFIPDMTIKENILFGKEFKLELYAQVVAACCLDYDFPTLPGGDETKLASNGSPLSGGQRKRVALARTLYDEAGELVLLDDIFSGLDAKTRTQLAVNVFGPNGYLQKRRAAAILCCTEAPAMLCGAANARFYQLDSGSLTVVEKAAADTSTDEATGKEAGDGPLHSESVTPTTPEPANETERVSHSVQASTVEGEEASDQVRGKSFEAYRIYLMSLGSLPSLIFVAILLLVRVGLEKGSSFWLSHWAGQYARSHKNINTGYYIGVYAAFAGAGLCVSFVMIRTPASTTELRQSETVNRFMNDIEAVDLDLPQALENLTTALGSSLGSLVVIAIGSPYAIISLVALLPLLWPLQRIYLSSSFQLRALHIAARAPMLEVASATVPGRLTVRALRAEKFLSQAISDKVYHALLMGYIFSSVQNWAILMLNLLNGCLATAVAGLLVGLGGSQSAGWGGLALVNTITLGQDAMLLLMWWTRFETSMASMERIFDYTHNTPQEKIVPPAAAVGDPWPERGSVTLDNLSLDYAPSSGKTSLLQAFFGLINNAGGTMHVDGAELSHVESGTLRRRLVGHPQKFVANSNGSVRENLDPDGDKPDARVEEVLGQVMTAEMCVEVMSKLDSKWNDCNFSEGWQQHIGICRTLLRNSTVYVLDEPTSGMSQARHMEVMDAILSLTAGKTVITTTHTLVGIEKFDQVIIIQDGRLVQHGSPGELIKEEGSVLNELIRADSRQ
ncbi:ABC transporter, transmembrane domain, type 1 [Beauveria brongniartii RCEF 3172]|uniref:ABC transporter, transmembrane domain, type 1 n=1 Tax=Beauveria brongniartii RCEF 3172 TaxID=1081107 RepID=A0A167CG11_9HYPO|nr:ABC transporter, transmembrane domain, type 1 [Beauveria brongniartii RCEF 3172]